MMIKVLLWLYAIFATLYWVGYMTNNDIIRAHATGFWFVLMVGGPLVLSALLLLKFLVRD